MPHQNNKQIIGLFGFGVVGASSAFHQKS